ncbi:class A sortase [Paenibacillus tritici]|uniref:class A sortase n=1 Tax=Paenibacillus tritici TaxID=1873425 RepID=UPI001BA7C1F1|nr:class A sortase [Paenibacillus tritici]QUL53504.1 class A sortase [Paenibacillus tritici]
MENRSRKRYYSIFSVILLLAGGGMMIYKPIMDYWISPNHLNSLYQTGLGAEGIKKNMESLDEQNQKKQVESFDFTAVENLGFLDKKATIKTENVIGGIYIPSVDINLPILYGATNENLRAASATMKPDQAMGEGNYAIAAHNSRNPQLLFGALKHVEAGDELFITNKDKVFKYTMVQSQVVMPERVDVIDDVADKTLLTLVTCYSSDGSDRLIVTGELEEIVDYSEVDSTIHEAFEPL